MSEFPIRRFQLEPQAPSYYQIPLDPSYDFPRSVPLQLEHKKVKKSSLLQTVLYLHFFTSSSSSW